MRWHGGSSCPVWRKLSPERRKSTTMMVAIVASDDDGRGLEGCPDLPDVGVVKEAGVVLPGGCCCLPRLPPAGCDRRLGCGSSKEEEEERRSTPTSMAE
ncbi:hypothetical protein Dimus_000880, partial [Dionaea muscipula]